MAAESKSFILKIAVGRRFSSAPADSAGLTAGTHLGPYLDVPASGNSITFELAAFYLFNEDGTKLIAERIYYDQASVMAQMQPASVAKAS